ncbi:hypothetical protein J1C56_27575 [Aminobacter anthyllidis]|uniref:Uncharacterized protein n=1 Tax=Aminobacter anthyllidis TaxID=1035067 RepID=A0A9X1AGP5_9HYPH|nr:hypothetical protein [Aminobacter anthyllidis]MBT1159337.1 hypothetical protein [Aminobacter anthyllidis]
MTRHALDFPNRLPSSEAIKPRWIMELELLALGIAANSQRSIAISAPGPDTGVTTICHALANVLAQSGLSTLVIDWTGNLKFTDKLTLQDRLRSCDYGARVPSRCSTLKLSSVGVLPDAAQFVELLDSTALRFDRLVFDLPSLSGTLLGQINPLQVASAADAFFLICMRNQEKRRVICKAVESASKAGVPISGLIMNDFHHSYIGNEIVRWANRHLRLAPFIKNPLVRLGTSIRELEEGTD